MADTVSQVRVFISSPGDVAVERDKARQVLEGLQRLYPGVSLVPVLWEELALPVTASFQEAIDLVLHKQPIDIAVFILWSRLGSPLGKSILKRDGSTYRSGTEREFDLILAAYEASRAEGGRRPVILAYGRDDEKGFRQRLASSPKDQLEELLEQRGLVEAFVREQFQDSEGHNLRAFHSYPDPVSFAQRLHTHLRNALDDLLAAEASRWPENPYRGLQCFDLVHAPIFHGRDEETCDLLQRLRERAAAGCGSVVIVGASGSGKSSLARAGVAAALVQHSYDESACWKVLTFIPSLADRTETEGDAGDAREEGLDLRLSLVRQMAAQVPGLSTGSAEELAADLAKSPEVTIRRGIVPALDRAGEAENQRSWRMLILLDQMEELWTDRRITSAQREQFLETLEALARSGRVALLATLRSDFYPAAQLSPTFLRLKEGYGNYDLLPPGAAALQRLIQEPARLAGMQFERGEVAGRSLDQMLVEEATRSPGALPLLQYLLDELYQARDVEKRLLTFAAYKQLGGLEGALGQRVATVYTECPQEAQAALPELFSRLVSIDVDSDQLPVRRRALLTDLRRTPARAMLTDRLIAARFLTTDRHGEAAVASLAHEALLRCWEQLAEWIRVNRDQLRLRARIEQSQQHWQEAKCEPSLLLSVGLPLEEGRQLLSHGALFTPSTAAYVQASIDHDNTLRRRVRRTRSLVLSALSLLTVAAVVAGTLAMFAKQEADNQRGVAQTQAGKAKAALLKSTRANARNKELLHQASMADHASAIKAWQEDYEARQQGRWTKSITGISKWHEAIALWSRALELEPTNQSARQWLYTTLWQRGLARRNLPLGEPLRHEGAVITATFCPDGARVLTISQDKALCLWDADSGKPLGKVRREGWVVCHSPDCARVLTASEDNTARVWDVASGTPLGEPLRHEGKELRGCFSPDGARVVTASLDKSARVWDAASGRPLGMPMHHESGVDGVYFSPDGSRVLTLSGTAARVWDAGSGKPLCEPMRHGDQVRHACFSPDGSRVVITSGENSARQWDAASGLPLCEPMRHGGVITSAIFSPDGSRIVTAGLLEAGVWDAASGKAIGEPLRHELFVNSVCFSPDGTRVLTASWDKTARLWEAASGKPLGEPLRHEDRVSNASFSADGVRVVTASLDKTARVWDAASGKPVGEPFYHDHRVTHATFSPDGSRVVTASWGMMALVWNAPSGAPLGEILRHEGPLNRAIFSPDGSRVVTTGMYNTARVWDATGDRALHHEGWIQSANFSPDGARIVTASMDKTARLWDAASGKPLGEPMGHGGPVWRALFSPDGSRIVTASQDKTVRLWDAANGKPLGEPLSDENEIDGVTFSPDGTRVVVTSGDRARVWDAMGSKPMGGPLLMEHFKARFSEDGSRVVAADIDNAVRVYDTANAKPLGKPLLHQAEVRHALFSPDGSRIVTFSGDNMGRVWDAASGRPLGEPLRHKNRILTASFSRDGTRVVTASSDLVRVWDAESGRPVGKPFLHPDLNNSGWMWGGSNDNRVNRTLFSPDGSRVVTVRDDAVHVWDAASGKPLGEPLRHPGGVAQIRNIMSASFGPDGSRFVTACEDKTAGVWDFPPRTPIVMPPAVPVWTLGIAGLQYNEGELEAIPIDERRALLQTPLPPGPWQELQSWLKTSGPQRKLTPSSGLTIRQIAERERDFGSRESLESALEYDPTIPLVRTMLGGLYEHDEIKRAKEPNQPAVDPSILARAAHWRRYDLDRLPAESVLWDRAAKILRELPDSKVGVGPKAISCAEAATLAQQKAAELRKASKSQ